MNNVIHIYVCTYIPVPLSLSLSNHIPQPFPVHPLYIKKSPSTVYTIYTESLPIEATHLPYSEYCDLLYTLWMKGIYNSFIKFSTFNGVPISNISSKDIAVFFSFLL